MTKKRIPKKRVDKVIKRNINEPRSINTLGKVIPELPSYRLLHILATGGYSRCILAQNIHNSEKIIIKRLNSITDPIHILREILVLKLLNKEENIVKLLCGSRSTDTYKVSLLFQYHPQICYFKLIQISKLADVKHYMFALLTALMNVHKYGIVHFDIKPENFLYDYQKKTGLLIDFGLSKLMEGAKYPMSITDPDPDHVALFNRLKAYPNKYEGICGTKGYLAPEILVMAIDAHSTATDIWPAGIILLSLLTKHAPIMTIWKRQSISYLCSKQSLYGLTILLNIFGIKEVAQFTSKYGVGLKVQNESNFHSIIGNHFKDVIHNLATTHRQNENHGELLMGLDLLSKMLTLDPLDRISANDALKHSFFDSIRETKFRQKSHFTEQAAKKYGKVPIKVEIDSI